MTTSRAVRLDEDVEFIHYDDDHPVVSDELVDMVVNDPRPGTVLAALIGVNVGTIYKWRKNGGRKLRLKDISRRAPVEVRWERFVRRGDPDRCWKWLGSYLPSGHGIISYQGALAVGPGDGVAGRSDGLTHRGPTEVL